MSDQHRHRPFHRRRRPPPGSPPGTLAPPPPEAPPARLRAIAYGPEGIETEEIAGAADLGRLDPLRARHAVLWVDVEGLGDHRLIEALGERFGLHALALEDVAHAGQRPKLEAYDDHLFVVVRMPRAQPQLASEQVALFLGDGWLLTFQEWPGDCFDPVRARLREGRGRIRRLGADYLAYALVDALIDSHFPILEALGERVEALEAEALAQSGQDTVARIHALKRDLLVLRRAVWPLRDTVGALLRDDTPLVAETTRVYLRDCHDHAFQLMDMVEVYREIAIDLIDIHLSSVAARTNEIMKVLTVIATIFIPLGFIAGVYGMNFDPDVSPLNMPELRWAFGYPMALALMAAVAAGLLGWFWRRGWLGGRGAARP
jgi:magnesium transporter